MDVSRETLQGTEGECLEEFTIEDLRIDGELPDFPLHVMQRMVDNMNAKRKKRTEPFDPIAYNLTGQG